MARIHELEVIHLRHRLRLAINRTLCGRPAAISSSAEIPHSAVSEQGRLRGALEIRQRFEELRTVVADLPDLPVDRP
jgi:hypothetical protein